MADEQEVIEETEPTEEDLKAKANADAEADLKAIESQDAALVASGQPRNVAAHPAVLASAGQHCMVKGCEWTFGDPVKGIEPHPTYVINVKPVTQMGAPKPEPPAPKPSEAKCAPINIVDTCGSCGWSAANSAEPHPVL